MRLSSPDGVAAAAFTGASSSMPLPALASGASMFGWPVRRPGYHASLRTSCNCLSERPNKDTTRSFHELTVALAAASLRGPLYVLTTIQPTVTHS